MKLIGIYVGLLGNGGIESAVVNQLVKMDHSLFQFEIIVDDVVDNTKYLDLIKGLGDRVVSLNLHKGRKFAYKYKKYEALKRLIKERKYDCFHFHSSFPSSLMYGRIPFVLRIPSVVTSHASGPASLSYFSKMIQSFSRCFFSHYFTHRIAVSQSAGKWMYGNNSFEVICNAIDTDRFCYNINKRNNIRSELGISEDVFLLGHIGRFAPEKNHDFIVDVFFELKKCNPNTHLLLIGDGYLKDKIIKKLSSYSLLNCCKFIDRTENIEDYLCAMDTLIFPSVREGFGLVAIEAQATCLPVVASEGVPLETKATSYIQYLSLNDSPKQWAEAINIIYNSHFTRSQEKLRSIVENYSLQNVVRKIEKYY